MTPLVMQKEVPGAKMWCINMVMLQDPYLPLVDVADTVYEPPVLSGGLVLWTMYSRSD